MKLVMKTIVHNGKQNYHTVLMINGRKEVLHPYPKLTSFVLYVKNMNLF